jgi:hypothetical protein
VLRTNALRVINSGSVRLWGTRGTIESVLSDRLLHDKTKERSHDPHGVYSSSLD